MNEYREKIRDKMARGNPEWSRWERYKGKILDPEREFFEGMTEEERKQEIRRLEGVTEVIEKYARKYDLDPNDMMEAYSHELASARISVTKGRYKWWTRENIEESVKNIVIEEYEWLMQQGEIGRERFEEVYDELSE